MEFHEFAYTVAGQTRTAKASRRDFLWGHGLRVEILDPSGQELNRVVFVCHPEFEQFERFQAMTTEQLASIAREKLESGRHEEDLTKARSHGLVLVLGLNGALTRSHPLPSAQMPK